MSILYGRQRDKSFRPLGFPFRAELADRVLKTDWQTAELKEEGEEEIQQPLDVKKLNRQRRSHILVQDMHAIFRGASSLEQVLQT